MQTSKISFIVLGIAVALLSSQCNNHQGRTDQTESSAPMSADGDANAIISSSAAVENNKDTTRRFIRTAEMKFKVNSVIDATYHIENIARQQGGFVTFTHLASHVNKVDQTAVSADSSLETTYYTVTNNMTLRVPNTLLDTTLKEISQNMVFLDHRIIKAEDVALQILSNKLTQKRAVTDTKEDTATVSKQERADNAQVSNLSLADQIKFSTINLSFYQRQSIKRELISNDKNIDAFEPSFGAKLADSFKFGWKILEELFLSLAKLWAIFLLIAVSVFVYKKFGRKVK